MVEKLKEMKDEVLRGFEQMLDERGGIARIDVKWAGEVADIIKDLAEAENHCWEAEYYKTVTQAMQSGGGSSGYDGSPANGGRMGYQQPGRMGYQGGGRSISHNEPMGHSDPVGAIRDMLATGSPELRAQIRSELSNLITMK